MRNGVADLIEIDIASEMVELQPVDGWMQHRMGAKVTIRVPFYVARLALHATNALSLPKLFTTTFVGLQFPADYEQLK